jgi:hypothetical protein
MANNYTDSFAGDPYFIQKGEQLSAAGMNAALNTKEKVANKKDTISNSVTEYPSSKAVSDALAGKANTSDVTSLQTTVAGKQDTLTAEQLSLLNSFRTLSFFPRGTILPISTTVWDEASSEFRTIWKICDGSNGTPNLVGKFIRGGAYANYGETGGTDTAQVPYHNHGVTDAGHGHSVADPGHAHHTSQYDTNSSEPSGAAKMLGGSWRNIAGYYPIYTNSVGTGISIYGNTTGISVNYAGTTADNRPVFYTLIFIMKVT